MPAQIYRNHYKCSECGHEWADEWCAQCNDKCPTCRAEIQPHLSEDTGKWCEHADCEPITTPEQDAMRTRLAALAEQARALGFAVVVFTPSELREVDAAEVEDNLTEAGNRYIEDVRAFGN